MSTNLDNLSQAFATITLVVSGIAVRTTRDVAKTGGA